MGPLSVLSWLTLQLPSSGLRGMEIYHLDGHGFQHPLVASIFYDRKHPSLLYQYTVMDLIQKEETSSKCKPSPAWFEGASLTLMIIIQLYD
jgi:hypothetical protein